MVQANKDGDDALPNYEDLGDLELVSDDGENVGAAAGASKPTGYVGVHSTSFKDMLLKPALLEAIVNCGFEHPSDVQQKCIPQAILGNDTLC